MALVNSVIINRLTYDPKASIGANLEKHFNEFSLKSTFSPAKVLDYSKPQTNIVTEARNTNFSTTKYNSTLSIEFANQAFNEQLAGSPLGPISRDDLFRELAPLFQWSKEDPFPYAICLIHHHFLLENGERMVTYGEPTAEQSSFTRPSGDLRGIIADRWFSTGEEFEHKVMESGETVTPPPTRDFLAKFREIVGRRGVDVLGICVAPDTSNLSPGQVFMETNVPGKRELELAIVDQPQSVTSDVYQTTWIPNNSPNAVWACSHICCV